MCKLAIAASLALRATYQILENKEHHSSCNLDEEDNQHDDEELHGWK